MVMLKKFIKNLFSLSNEKKEGLKELGATELLRGIPADKKREAIDAWKKYTEILGEARTFFYYDMKERFLKEDDEAFGKYEARAVNKGFDTAMVLDREFVEILDYMLETESDKDEKK